MGLPCAWKRKNIFITRYKEWLWRRVFTNKYTKLTHIFPLFSLTHFLETSPQFTTPSSKSFFSCLVMSQFIALCQNKPSNITTSLRFLLLPTIPPVKHNTIDVNKICTFVFFLFIHLLSVHLKDPIHRN